MAVLSQDKTYVTVEKGDTLSEIARDYGDGKTYQQLAAINNIPNADLIRIGQKIKLTESGSSSSSSTSLLSVKVLEFGLQADIDNVLFVTWEWNKDHTKEYQVRWDYYTDNKLWFVGSETTTKYKYSTYSIPSNAKQVRVRIKPVSSTYEKNDKETTYWSSLWCGWQKHTISNPPNVPPVPTVTLDGLKLTATVANLTSDPSIVQFEVVKDDSTACATIKATVKTSSASCSTSVSAGSSYKVRCRAHKDNLYSDWSVYSSSVNTIPATPSKFVKCEPKTQTSIYLEWTGITNATSYDIEYATDKTHFDGSDKVISKTGITGTSYELSTDIQTGTEYFFRLRAVNSVGSSGWSEISSAIIGTGPAAPTTWSSTTTVISGEPLNLYWVHNSKDGSSQTYAELELIIDGSVSTYTIENTTNEEEKDKTSSYSIDTSSYAEGVKISWRVRTAGISKQYGEWSIQRVVDIYAPPTMQLSVTNSEGESFETLESLPFNISALTGPATQRPIGYHLSIVANETYETVDNVGNEKIVSVGETIYSRHFDISDVLSVEISAGDLSLENGIGYTIICTASMNSGLTAESSVEFTVSWVDTEYEPNAEISIDEDTFSAYIRPYCATYSTVYYRVNRRSYPTLTYELTSDIIQGVYGSIYDGAVTTTGEQVYYGTAADGEQIYYCVSNLSTPIESVLMSVYRREFDGTFTELASGLDGSKNTTITDPHPALDYARYRIVAVSKNTGTVSYYDMPAYPVGGKSVIIQWDETWSEFEIPDSGEVLESPVQTGSLLVLPYNIDVSDKHNSDVELVEYIGRKHPVSYYGTHLGETSTWTVEIDKTDKDTLYALRRLAIWMGNVYVREPSGSGYWANVSVSLSQKHRELTIPVTLEIARVEGGA